MKLIDLHQPNGVRYLIVADDLTGACDSAIAFTGRGMAVEVPLASGAKAPDQGVFSISTESRDIPEEEAKERVRNALLGAERAGEVFKKIDSVLRGNTFAEIRAAVECFACGLVVLSPAYPAMGRTVKDGVLHIADGTEERLIDLSEGLRNCGLNDLVVLPTGELVERGNETMRGAMRTRHRLLLCDAECEEDLRAAVKTARGLGERILWIGSGGLAHALAQDLPQDAKDLGEERRAGCVLLFVGSDHAVTVKQVAELRRSGAVAETSVEDCSKGSPESPVVVLKVSRGVTTEEAVRQSVMNVASHGIACCLLTGGDTAAFVCRALGVDSLRLMKEFSPGLPQAVAKGGVLDGIPVILKSGGFGGEDVLCRVADRFVSRREFV